MIFYNFSQIFIRSLRFPICILTRGRPIIHIKIKLIRQEEEELWIFKVREFFYKNVLCVFNYTIIPIDIICFKCARLVTLPSLVLMTAGLILWCSNKPCKGFPSKSSIHNYADL